MPILPQAFWYKVDGKLKQVYFEEAKIPPEKRDALMQRMSRTRNYGGADEQQPVSMGTEKEKLYGWYPLPDGSQFVTVNQAKLDRRVLKPNDHRAVPVVPDDRTREPVSTQIGPDGIAACIPPYPTDPMAYRFSAENTTQLPTQKAAPDFARWQSEEAGRIPQWNDVVTFHSATPTPPEAIMRPRTIAAVKALEDEPNLTAVEGAVRMNDKFGDSSSLAPPMEVQNAMMAQLRRPVTHAAAMAPAKSPAPSPPQKVPRTPSTQPPKQQQQPVQQRRNGGMRVDSTPIINTVNAIVNKSFATAPPSSGTPRIAGGSQPLVRHHSQSSVINHQQHNPPSSSNGGLSLREIQEMQKKLASEYRWRFHIHGDPFAVKSKARPSRPAHWITAKADAPKQTEKHIHFADSSTFFYNTIPVIPLSFSVGQGLASEKVIRDREAKQKFAPKSTPDDRFFIPAFIY